ncbi:MAG: hypothetical protein KDA63_18300, partial [Planctomycetales bacterium]|nr:hypothetical protein [Planctomycetales bacterium]
MSKRLLFSIGLLTATLCPGAALAGADENTVDAGSVAASAGDDEGVVAANAAGIEFFEKQVRPLFVAHCYDCHGPEEQESRLRLDRYADILTGGAAGAAIVPGDAAASLLIGALRYDNTDLQMPPDGRLSDAEIAV